MRTIDLMPNRRPQKCVSCGQVFSAPAVHVGEAGVTCSLACFSSYLECYPRPKRIRLFASAGWAYPSMAQVLPEL